MVFINGNKIKLFVGRQPTMFHTVGLCVFEKQGKKREDKHLFVSSFFFTTSTNSCLHTYSCMRYQLFLRQPNLRKRSSAHGIMNCKDVSRYSYGSCTPSIASTIQFVPTSLQIHRYKINKLKINTKKVLASIVHVRPMIDTKSRMNFILVPCSIFSVSFTI